MIATTSFYSCIFCMYAFSDSICCSSLFDAQPLLWCRYICVAQWIVRSSRSPCRGFVDRPQSVQTSQFVMEPRPAVHYRKRKKTGHRAVNHASKAYVLMGSAVSASARSMVWCNASATFWNSVAGCAVVVLQKMQFPACRSNGSDFRLLPMTRWCTMLLAAPVLTTSESVMLTMSVSCELLQQTVVFSLATVTMPVTWTVSWIVYNSKVVELTHFRNFKLFDLNVGMNMNIGELWLGIWTKSTMS